MFDVISYLKIELFISYLKRRDKPGHIVTVTVVTPGVTWPGVVIIVRRRSRLAPYPIVFHSSESSGVQEPLLECVRAHGP